MTILEKAFAVATKHPRLYHPMTVCALVLKYGGDEAQAAAALLHDTICDGKTTEADLAREVGEEAARLTFAFADPPMSEEQAASWRGSKGAYLDKLRSEDDRALLIVACEEMHELGELLHDLRYQGAKVWSRYKVPGMELFWYYRELAKIFVKALRGERYAAVVGEYGALLKELSEIVFEGRTF